LIQQQQLEKRGEEKKRMKSTTISRARKGKKYGEVIEQEQE
jgi:hypothetical protein